MGAGPFTAARALLEADACDRARVVATELYERQMAYSRAAPDYAVKKAASDFAGFASCEARHQKRRADAWRVLADELREREEARAAAPPTAAGAQTCAEAP